MPNRSRAEPRSFITASTPSEAAAISASGPRWRAAGMPTPSTRRRANVSTSRFSRRYPASATTSSSFTNSPGCTCTPPTRIHSRAPLTVVPATIVNSRSPTATVASVYL